MRREQYDNYYLNNTEKPKGFVYYVHNPRTGGTYIKNTAFETRIEFQWFGKNGNIILGYKDDDHPCVYEKPLVSYPNARNQKKSYLNDPYFLDTRSLVVSTIRNPYDRYVSAYLEAKHTYDKYQNFSFEQFIDEVCDPEYKPDEKYGFSFELSRNFFPYQIFGDCGKCVADLVIRKELLNDGLQILADLLDIPFNRVGSSNDPPEFWKNKRIDCGVSKDRDYRDFYNNKTVDIVKTRRNKELSAFNYDFENNHDGICLINPSYIEYHADKDEIFIHDVNVEEVKPINVCAPNYKKFLEKSKKDDKINII